MTHAGSSKHTHHQRPPSRNLHAALSPMERLERLCAFLESHFGQTVSLVSKPKVSYGAQMHPLGNGASGEAAQTSDHADFDDLDEPNEDEFGERDAVELARLHRMGIPVPGVELKVDKHVARVWLETLEVECSNRTLRDRVQAVVDRAVETIAPLWSARFF